MGHDILIVDDERDICTLIAGILEDEGHTARRAHNSSEAVEAVRQRTYSAGEVLIIRNEGPVGGPGMREMLGVTALIYGQGVGENCHFFAYFADRAKPTAKPYLGFGNVSRPILETRHRVVEGDAQL